MIYTGKRKVLVGFILSLTFLVTLGIGTSLGYFLSTSVNTDIRSDLSTYKPALPTQILDRKGELITEIFSDEKRDIVPIRDIPKILIYALISQGRRYIFQTPR